MLRVFLTILFSLIVINIDAAPVITNVVNNGTSLVITGTGFGAGATIVSWDNFDSHTPNEEINGTSPIIGPNWSIQTSGGTSGVIYENTHVHSGTLAAHVDWDDPTAYSIRAFGWANQGPYTQLYITYWRYMDGTYTTSNPSCNHKQLYLFGTVNPEISGGTPQFISHIPGGNVKWGAGPNYSDSSLTYNVNNNINNVSNPSLQWVWSNTDDVFQRWEFWIVLNSPYTEYNGRLEVWMNGQHGISNTSYRGRYVDGSFKDFRLGNMAQNFMSTAEAWFDDVYIATSPARVEIGDNAIFDSCTSREIQPHSNWTSSECTVTINNGGFGTIVGKYVYLVGEDLSVSNSFVIPAVSGEGSPQFQILFRHSYDE